MELIRAVAAAGLGSRHESVNTRHRRPYEDSNTNRIEHNNVVGGIAQVGLRRAPLFRPREPSIDIHSLCPLF